MTAATSAAGSRLITLDVIRGIAVMGILLANLPAFGLPGAAYFSPLAWGGTSPPDLATWFATFILVEGKMRGLFSFLFGASILLVIDRARASDRHPATVHFARMTALLLFGLMHLYLIWWGDILAHYALLGMIAFSFSKLPARALVQLGILTLALAILWSLSTWLALLASAARDTPQTIAFWNALSHAFGTPPAADVAREIAAMRGGWLDNLAWRLAHADTPLDSLLHIGLQTFSAMLFGMAALRSGFLTGEWPRRRYRRWALVSLGIALPVYALLGLETMAHGFDQRFVFFASVVISQPFRILAVAGYAALIILAVSPGGRLTERVAAVGRAAFTNYLGTSLIVTAIFDGWGLGLFGSLSRAQLYLVAPIVWLLMLAWSKPWLDRFAYGPFEWLWRSLARWELQPMRKRLAATSLAAEA